ncbi:hypothetical protein L7F22_065457 [Adiantum nelumboides]|nr:hypothetical protein [Adiantum nelumboides]
MQARKQADIALRKLFYAEGIPYWKVRSPCFVEMVKAIGRAEDSYVPPSYHALHLEDEVKCIDIVIMASFVTAVAKALRVVAEGKARALEEAAEWKRKYELECLRNKIEIGTTSPSIAEQKGPIPPPGPEDWSLHEQNGSCCGKDGICSHEVLEKEESSLKPNKLDGNRMLSKKVSFNLAWGCDGVKNRHHKHDVVSFERGNITTAVRSSKQIILVWDSAPQSVAILAKPNSSNVHALCTEMVKWLKEDKGMDIFLEPRVKKELLAESSIYSFIQTWETDEDVETLHTKVDLVITLGGDGTVLWAASMFKGPVPPLVSFAMGSLGFMTPFQSDRYRECLDNIIKGPLHITLRHRLHCRIVRAADRDETGERKKNSDDFYLVLNEVSIDRGMSSFLTFLECYCDNSFVTCVQGDGLIISTTSGSTAYSLAAGGSMVHPQVPGILFTPICPHSLSFRPLILPEYVSLRVQVPFNSRGQAWASFDGKDRQQLQAGDALLCNMSQWPVPTMCEVESTHDFLRSVREGLHWNMRKSQSADGPRDGHASDHP